MIRAATSSRSSPAHTEVATEPLANEERVAVYLNKMDLMSGVRRIGIE